MRFKLYTLVDITETTARRSEDPKQFRQQQNFQTVMQTIGLRVNPIHVKSPQVVNDLPSKYNLGSKYKTKQNIWEYAFDIEYADGLDVDTLVNDFDLIPIITGLDETATFENAHFLTKNSTYTNIYFEIVDK
tara:strand:+ start:526 stop:921 length:396 start_codon:yes stop_codon:yes gene_type:complete